MRFSRQLWSEWGIVHLCSISNKKFIKKWFIFTSFATYWLCQNFWSSLLYTQPLHKNSFFHQFLSYNLNLVARMVYFNGKGLKNEDWSCTLKHVIFAGFRLCKKLTEFHKFILFEKLMSGIIAHFKGNYVPMKIVDGRGPCRW